MSLLERAQAHSVSSPCPRLSFVTLFSLRVGIRGEKAKRGRLSLPPHTHIPLRNTPVRDPPLPLQPPPKHFHINNQAIFLHANPSKRAGANLQAWGWVVCAASSFQVCPTPWQTFVPLYVAHKAPALSALIDQRPVVKEESSTPYQWCSTSAPEKSLRLFPQHAQCRGDNESR